MANTHKQIYLILLVSGLLALITMAMMFLPATSNPSRSIPSSIVVPITVANTTAEVEIASSTMPHGLMHIGAIFEGNTSGTLISLTGSAGTITCRNKTNGVTVATRVVDMGTGLGSVRGWHLHSFRTLRSTGPTASMAGQSIFTLDGFPSIVSPASVTTLSTNQDAVFSLTVQFSVADVDNRITLEQGYIARR